MSERTPERLTRLLSLVSYLTESGPVTVAHLAHHFRVTPAQITSDINTLWVSGTPGYLADDLIDFDYDSYESGTIKLTAHRGLNKPLRLGAREAMSLVASLNALRELVGKAAPEHSQDGVHTNAALPMVSNLIDQLSGFLGTDANALDVKLDVAGAQQVLGTIRGAIAARHGLDIDYVTADDRRLVRTVEPFQIINDGDRFYLIAFCHTAQQERMFRLDRIVEATGRMDVAITHTPAAGQQIVPRSNEVATLTLKPGNKWLVEHLPNRGFEHHKDGSITLEVEVAHSQWLETVLLQFAPLIVSVSSQSVAQRVAHRAQQTLEIYELLGLGE